MKKLLIIVFLLLSLVIPSVYGGYDIFINRGSNNITYTDSSLKEFANSYPEEYIKTFQLSNLPDSYQDYKIDGVYVFYIYKERPFNVEVTVFKDGVVLDYIPETTNKDVSISWRLNESFNSLFVGTAYVNMASSRYGMKFKRTFFSSEKLIETLVVFSNNSININPKMFASEIAQDDFINDLKNIMSDKQRQICEPYNNYYLYPKIIGMCMDMEISSNDFYDYSSNYLSGGVNEFETALQDLNQKIPHYRDFHLMADKWNTFINSDSVNFNLSSNAEINSSFWSIRNNITTNESYTYANLDEDLTNLNNSINTVQSELQNKSINSRLSNFYNQFQSYIIAIIILIATILGYLLVFRQVIKERHQIKNEITNSFKACYVGLYKLIEPKLLQIKSLIQRYKKEEKR